MKDAYELLRQKEAELARIRHEVASLKIVAPMLSEESPSDPRPPSGNSEEEGPPHPHSSEATGTEDMFSFTAASRPTIWNVLKRGK